MSNRLTPMNELPAAATKRAPPFSGIWKGAPTALAAMAMLPVLVAVVTVTVMAAALGLNRYTCAA